MMLKQSLVNYLIGGYLIFNSFTCESKSYELINVIIDDFNIKNISSQVMTWREYGYKDYSDLNHKNVVNNKHSLNLDDLFNNDQRKEIDNFLQSPSRIKIKSKCFENKVQVVNESTDRSNLGIVHSFSSPLILKGRDDTEFGIVILCQSFFGEGKTTYLVYEKKQDAWVLLHEKLISFS
jgi:hypothetical protein